MKKKLKQQPPYMNINPREKVKEDVEKCMRTLLKRLEELKGSLDSLTDQSLIENSKKEIEDITNAIDSLRAVILTNTKNQVFESFYSSGLGV